MSVKTYNAFPSDQEPYITGNRQNGTSIFTPAVLYRETHNNVGVMKCETIYSKIYLNINFCNSAALLLKNVYFII